MGVNMAKFKDLRKHSGLTQQMIANKIFVNQKTISNWEKGQREPSCQILPKLADVLNCSIEELVLAIIETKNNAKTKDLQS